MVPSSRAISNARSITSRITSSGVAVVARCIDGSIGASLRSSRSSTRIASALNPLRYALTLGATHGDPIVTTSLICVTVFAARIAAAPHAPYAITVTGAVRACSTRTRRSVISVTAS